MSMAPSCRKPCSNSLPDGHTTDPWLALVMQEAALKTRPSLAFRSRAFRPAKLNRECLVQVRENRRFIETISLLTTYMSFINISTNLDLFLFAPLFLLCWSHCSVSYHKGVCLAS